MGEGREEGGRGWTEEYKEEKKWKNRRIKSERGHRKSKKRMKRTKQE